jgi:hypothetical protein
MTAFQHNNFDNTKLGLLRVGNRDTPPGLLVAHTKRCERRIQIERRNYSDARLFVVDRRGKTSCWLCKKSLTVLSIEGRQIHTQN